MEDATTDGSARVVAYHGLGYVGLTGALHFAHAGFTVIGYDPNAALVEAINSGCLPPAMQHFISYLGEDAKPERYQEKFRATSRWDAISGRDVSLPKPSVHIIAVPTEKNDEPWMELVQDVVKKLLDDPETGDALIIIESTLTPGTIDEILNQRFEPEREYLIAHAPRRDWFAGVDKSLATVSRVVGGIDPVSTRRAIAVLEHVTPLSKILRTDHRTAELVKPLENALFHLPIMLGHEIAMRYPDHDVAKALELAVTHWRFSSFGGLYVGLGSGGRCVPMGPKYLIAGGEGAERDKRPVDEVVEYNVGLLERSLMVEQDITDASLTMIVDYLFELNGPADAREMWVDLTGSVLILGLGYRPDFNDFGFSPGLRLAKRLRAATPKVEVYVHDGVASTVQVDAAIAELRGAYHRHVIEHHSPAPPFTAPYTGPQYDVVVLATPHAIFDQVPAHLMKSGTLVLDARGTWASWAAGEEAKRLDVIYRQVGRPGWRG